MDDKFFSIASVHRQRSTGGSWQPPERLLALDPGDTTGWALFLGGSLHDKGQIPGTIADMTRLFDLHLPTQIVFEEYRIYPWKLAEHAGSTVPTLRLIGAIETLCEQRSIPYLVQSAQSAKGFMTDEKLREWNYFPKTLRHAADAVRHGCYAVLFNPGIGLAAS